MSDSIEERIYMSSEIVNKVAKSALITFDLEDYYDGSERVLLDIKDNLYQGMILKEKDFRAFVNETDWSIYRDKNVAITCSTDAIIPTWAYMLLTVKLEPYANIVVLGNLTDIEHSLFQEALSKIDFSHYKDAKVVIKGCSNLPVPESAYVEITRLLRPYASSIMYGEPCSTVPLYKKGKK